MVDILAVVFFSLCVVDGLSVFLVLAVAALFAAGAASTLESVSARVRFDRGMEGGWVLLASLLGSTRETRGNSTQEMQKFRGGTQSA